MDTSRWAAEGAILRSLISGAAYPCRGAQRSYLPSCRHPGAYCEAFGWREQRVGISEAVLHHGTTVRRWLLANRDYSVGPLPEPVPQLELMVALNVLQASCKAEEYVTLLARLSCRPRSDPVPGSAATKQEPGRGAAHRKLSG